jgi:hypothetical protein
VKKVRTALCFLLCILSNKPYMYFSHVFLITLIKKHVRHMSHLYMGFRKFLSSGSQCFFFLKKKNLISFINQRTRAVCSKETMLHIYVIIYYIQTLSMTCLTTTLANLCAAQLASQRTKLRLSVYPPLADQICFN